MTHHLVQRGTAVKAWIGSDDLAEGDCEVKKRQDEG